MLARQAGGPDTLCSAKFLAPVGGTFLGQTGDIRFGGIGPED